MFGRCGVFCSQCPTFRGDIQNTAKKLKIYVKSNDWVDELGIFDFKNFMKGIDYYINLKCETCHKAEEPWCEVLKCEKIISKEMRSCLECQEFLSCSRTEYQRNRYPIVIEYYNTVKEKGFEVYLKEGTENAKQGVTFLDYRTY
jgi:hypothetical protein